VGTGFLWFEPFKKTSPNSSKINQKAMAAIRWPGPWLGFEGNHRMMSSMRKKFKKRPTWEMGLIFFTVPIVVQTLEQVGLPPPVDALDSEQRGIIKVTLAVKLAELFERLLIAEISTVIPQEVSKLFMKDNKIAENARRLAILTEEEARCNRDLIILEQILGSGFPEVIYRGEPGCATNRTIVRKEVEKMPEGEAKEVLANCYDPYMSQGRAVSKIRWKIRQLRRQNRALSGKLENDLQLQKDLKDLFERQGHPVASQARLRDRGPMLQVNVQRESPYLRSPLCECLRGVHYIWWVKFTSAVLREIEISTKRSYLVLARDAPLQAAINHLMTKPQGRLTKNSATLEVWANPHKYKPGWHYPPYQGQTHLDRLRQELAQIDKTSRTWLSQNGGKYHPFNLYKRKELEWIKANAASPEAAKLHLKNAREGREVPYGNHLFERDLLKALQPPSIWH
jgi:hypothetical protein